MKRILTYGTFDYLHIWHINILRRAKELWDYLIVWLSTDEFNSLKWKKSHSTYDERKKILEAIRYVDLVIPEENRDQKTSDVNIYKADVFVMWDDWEWKFDFLKEQCEVLYFPRTKWISTTQIKKWL